MYNSKAPPGVCRQDDYEAGDGGDSSGCPAHLIHGVYHCQHCRQGKHGLKIYYVNIVNLQFYIDCVP